MTFSYGTGGGPTFPIPGSEYSTTDYGMTLRDWFAGQALTGVMAACANDTRGQSEPHEAMFARKAYAIADAMLSERAK